MRKMTREDGAHGMIQPKNGVAPLKAPVVVEWKPVAPIALVYPELQTLALLRSSDTSCSGKTLALTNGLDQESRPYTEGENRYNAIAPSRNSWQSHE